MHTQSQLDSNENEAIERMLKTTYSLILLMLIAMTLSCQQRTSNSVVPVEPTTTADEPTELVVAKVAAEEVENEAEKNGKMESDGYWKKITDLYGNAKSSGRTTAANVTEWLSEVYVDTTSKGAGAVDETSDRVQQLYQQAKERGETSATTAKQWVADDLAQIGAWQYRTLLVSTNDPQVAARDLNKLGADRWECFWVDQKDSQTVFYLKRSGRSYLRQVPAKELFRMLPLFGLDGDSGSE